VQYAAKQHTVDTAC